MSIQVEHPSINFDVACLLTTILQVMRQNCEIYEIKAKVLNEIKDYSAEYPTLCGMLLRLPICEDIELPDFFVLCKRTFEQSERDFHIISDANVFK